MNSEEIVAVVIDNGTDTCKIGFSNEERPKGLVPTIVGRPKHAGIMTGMGNQKSHYIGDEAMDQRSILSLKYPIERGIIQNWEDMERVWTEIYSQLLKVSAQDYPCMMTDEPQNPKHHKQRTTQIAFQNFEVPAFYLGTQAVLALYASGRTTGTVVDIGHGVNHVVSINEGKAIEQSIQRVSLGGQDMTMFLVKMLSELGYHLSTNAELEIVKQIKHQVCYLAPNYDSEMNVYHSSSAKECFYDLPDGNQITIGSQRFRCPEILFKPDLVGSERPGIHYNVHNSILKCDPSLRTELYNNIILSGGSSLFPSLPERLASEVNQLVGVGSNAKVVAPQERLYSTWIGGKILASLSTFKEQWITRAQYEQHGPGIVHSKC